MNKYANRVQKVNGITRFEWQVLNMLSQTGKLSRENIFHTKQTFIDEPALNKILNRLLKSDWIEQMPDDKSESIGFQLIAEGKERHKFMLATQKEARKKIMQGIGETEYAITLRVCNKL